MNTFLMWLGGLLVAVLAALFVVPHFIDWNSYRGVFETQASRILGRDVRVGGEVNLRFLPTPYVRFERVRIAEGNEAGFGGRSFFRAESFTMWLTVPPLLKGVLEAHEVELRRPSLRLAVDDAGRGNWRTFKVQSGTLPFVPAGVSLQSVNITDGIVTFDAADGEESVRVEGVNGELSAQALGGPYKFDGTVTWRGGVREVKFATFESPRSEPDVVPMHLQVWPKDTRNTYVIEGELKNLTDIPQFVGDLKADIALTNHSSKKSAGDRGSNKDPSTQWTTGIGRPHIAMTGKITGSGTEASITNLVASFEDVGQPQLLNGEAKLSYGTTRDFEIGLSSRWLDLDKLLEFAAEGDRDALPLGLLGAIMPEIAEGLPENFTTNAQLSVEQVQLGGDAVSGVRVNFVQKDGVLGLRSLSAGLPGGARLKLSGTIKRSVVASASEDKTPTAKFSGNLFVGGPSMVRTYRWATQRADGAQDFSDGAFSFAGNITLSPTVVSLKKVKAEYSGRPVNGNLVWKFGAEKTLDVLLEGHVIDAGWFGIDKVTVSTFQNGVSPGEPVEVAAVDAGKEDGASNTGERATDALPSDGRFLIRMADRTAIRLKAGRFNNGGDVLRDVDADVRISKDAVLISTLKFQTDTGLNVAVDGAVTNTKQATKGLLNWQAGVAGPDGVAQLTRLLNLDSKDAGASRLVEVVKKLAPLDMAGTIGLGQRQKNSLDILADGLARDGRTILTAQLDGGASEWRTAPIDATLDIENAHLTHILGLLSGSVSTGDSYEAERAGRATIKAVGTASQKLLTAAQISSDGLNANFTGYVTVGESDIETAEGQLELDTSDMREALLIAGLPMAEGARGIPAAGKITLARDEGAWVYWPETFTVAGQKVSGSLVLLENKSAGSGISVAGKLAVAAADFQSLLSPVLKAGTAANTLPQPVAPKETVTPANNNSRARAKSQKKSDRDVAEAAAKAAADAEARRKVFSDQTFDFAAIGAVTGDLEIRIGSLALVTGLVLNDAEMKLGFEPGKIILRKLTGSAAGGQLSAKATLAEARAGVTFAGDLRLENANLADLIPGVALKSEATGAPGEAPSQTAAGTVNAAADGATAGGAAPSPVSGTMTLVVNASGQALGLAGLVSSLQGEGETELEEVVIRGMSPGAVTTAANAALVEDKALEGEDLLVALRQQLAQGEAIIPASKIPLKVVDGAVRFAAFRTRSRAGTMRNVTTVDLSSLSVDSSWQLAPSKPKASGDTAQLTQAWPGIDIVFVGKLANLGQLSPQIAAGAVERELAVRRIQRNVDELERLRREDKQRAEEERERRRQRELERARAAEREDAAPTPPSPSAETGVNAPQSNSATAEGVAQSSEFASEVVKEDLPAVDEKKIKRRIKRKRRRKRLPEASDFQRFDPQAPAPF